MQIVEAVLKLLDTYPPWAKAVLLGLVVLIAAVLLFAKSPPKPERVPGQDPLYLRITRVDLFPDDSSADVRVIISVNNTDYIFPSVGGVQWMKVGPDMGQKIIPLPKADLYKLQFRLEYRDGQVASNEVPYTATVVENGKPTALTLPHRQEYMLYRVVGGAASSGVAAIVKYELTNDGR